jgi:hypothetical protein
LLACYYFTSSRILQEASIPPITGISISIKISLYALSIQPHGFSSAYLNIYKAIAPLQASSTSIPYLSLTNILIGKILKAVSSTARILGLHEHLFLEFGKLKFYAIFEQL